MQTFDDLIELFQVAKPAIARGARASLLRLLHLTTPSITEATRIMDYVVRTADAEIAEACLRRKMFNKNAFLHKILDNPDKQDRSRLFDLAAEASFMSEENDQVHITNDRVANKPIPLGPVAIAALPGRKTSTSCRRSGKAPDSAVKEALHPDGFGMITESFSREGDVLDFGSASSRPRNGNPSAPAFTSRSHSTLPDRYAPSTPSDAFATPRSPWSLSSVKSDSGSIPSSHRSTPPSTPSNRRQRNADNGPLATALPHCQRFNSWQNRRKERADGGALDPIPSSRLEPVAEEKKENEDEDIYWESTRAESCTGRSREAGVVESATIRMGDDCDTLVDAARNDRRKQGIETAKHECMEWAGNTNEWNQKLPRNPGEVQNSSRESGEVMNEEKKYVEVEMRNGPAGETTRLVALDFTHLSGRNMADSICVSTQDMPDLIRDSANVAQDTPTRLTLETPDSVRCTTRVRENTWYAKQIVESQPANTPLRQYTLDSSRELIHQVTLSTPNAAYALSQQITRGVPNMTRELADQMTRDMPNSMRGPAQPMAHDVTDAPQLLPHALRQDASSSTHGDPGHPISRDSRNPIDPPSIILEVHQPMRGAPAPDMPQPNTPTPYTPSDSLLSTSRDHNLSSPASCPPPTYDGISSTTPPWPDENLFTSPSADHTQAASGTPGRSCGEISATTPPLPDDDNALVSSIGIEPPLNPTHSLANAQLSPKTSPSRHNYDTHEPLTSIDGALKSADSKPPVNSLSVGGALQPVSESVTERSDTPPWRCQRTPLSPHSSTGKTTPRFAQEEEAAPTIMIPRPLHPRTLTFDDLDHVSQPHSARGDTLPRVAKLTVPRRTLSFSDENNGVSCSPSSDYERLCAYATAASTTCSPNAPLPCESRILSRHHRSASPAEGDAHEASNNRAPWISDAPLSVEMLTEALMKLPPQRAWQELFDRIGEAWADDDQLTLLSAVGNRLCDALTSRSGILVLDVSRIPFQAWIKLSFVPLLVPHVSPQSVGIEALNIISLSSLAAPQSKAANGLMRLHERCRDLISHSITIPERTRHLDAMRAIVDGESVALAEYVNHLVDQYGQVPSYGDAKAFAEHNMLPFVFPDFLLDELKKQLCRNELTCVKATLQLINALLTHVPAATMIVVRRCGEAVARLLKNRGALKALAEDVLTRMGWRIVWNECRQQASRGKKNKSGQQQRGISISTNNNGYMDDLMLYLTTVLDDSATVDGHVVDVCKFLHNEATQSPQNRTALQACRLIPHSVLNQLPRKLFASLQQCLHHKPKRCGRSGAHDRSHISAVSRSVSPTQSSSLKTSMPMPPPHRYSAPPETCARQYSARQSPPRTNYQSHRSSPLSCADQGNLTARENDTAPSSIRVHQAPNTAGVCTQFRPSSASIRVPERASLRPSKVFDTSATSADTNVPCGLRALRPPWVQTLLGCAEEDLTVAYAEVTSGLKKTDFIRVSVRALAEVLQRLVHKMAVDARTPLRGEMTRDDVLLLLSQFLGLSPPARLCIALLSISPTGADPLADQVIDRLLTYALQTLESAENAETGSLDLQTLLSYAGRSTLAGTWRPKLAATISHLNPHLCTQFLEDTGHAQSFGGQLTRALRVNEARDLWED
eukprot:GEMP01000793.1.p1 GENE.GEMP01000793.1~~GEMP01000793.1.p1  ORF type:complete len:1617 (+),score=335.93 GEMP01000793.1:173-5023(+)